MFIWRVVDFKCWFFINRRNVVWEVLEKIMKTKSSSHTELHEQSGNTSGDIFCTCFFMCCVTKYEKQKPNKIRPCLGKCIFISLWSQKTILIALEKNVFFTVHTAVLWPYSRKSKIYNLSGLTTSSTIIELYNVPQRERKVSP